MSTIAADPPATDTPDSRPAAAVGPAVRKLLKPLASLQLAVALFALSMGLVFFGTLAQKTAGIWTVVDRYFWSWGVLVDGQPLVEFAKVFLGVPKDAVAPDWLRFPWPGGKLIGGLMFLNLLAAHVVRFKFGWKKLGVTASHSGILLLFVGEAVTREFQVEQRMTIAEGESTSYAEDGRNYELAFTGPAAGGTSPVVVIPARMLAAAAKSGERLSHPDLPVDVRVDQYMAHSDLLEGPELAGVPNPATAGLGLKLVAKDRHEVRGVDMSQEVDVPAAYLTFFKKGTDEPVGTFLASLWFNADPFEKVPTLRQAARVGTADYDLSLRRTRYYKPFTLTLNKFKFDRYVGTGTPKNYSSDLTLTDPERGQTRDVHVAMNDPMRYRGETFYQADFDKKTESKTVLQVVRNPGWVIPYVACALVSGGLLLHFLMSLTKFLGRRPKAAARLTRAERLLPWLVAGLGVLLLIGMALPKTYGGRVDLQHAARLPVVDGGRLKPLDTVARVYLRKVSGREEFEDRTGIPEDSEARGKLGPAVRWLLDCLSGSMESPGVALDHRVVRIDNSQVKDLLGLKPRDGNRYSLKEIAARYDDFKRAALKAKPRRDVRPPEPDAAADGRVAKLFEAGDRDLFAAQLLETDERIDVIMQLLNRQAPLVLPPGDGKEWRSYRDVAEAAKRSGFMAAFSNAGVLPKDFATLPEDQQDRITAAADRLRLEAIAADPAALKFAELMAAYRTGRDFDASLSAFRDTTAGGVSVWADRRVRFEEFLNEFAPAYAVMFLYGPALVLTYLGWGVIPFNAALGGAVRRSAYRLLMVALLAHTFALAGRMFLMDRPLVFVTNLYSSAIFIGWAAAVVSLALERVTKLGIGNAVAAAIGLGTSFIAHNILAAGSDTLEMMQAVLDTNFWLATHVTTVTLGYSATFVAGLLGLAYVVIGVFTPLLRRPVGDPGPGGKSNDLGKVIGQVMYGVICLAALLSFVGTVLGGIWADQSWGRFWGWDPKENGAVLIVIWNALILHARWCGLVKDRGVAVLALAGNMVTTWSWFGTNQLGVGLHAYGFSNDLVRLCDGMWAGHLGLIGLGLVPTRFWASYQGLPASPVR